MVFRADSPCLLLGWQPIKVGGYHRDRGEPDYPGGALQGDEDDPLGACPRGLLRAERQGGTLLAPCGHDHPFGG